jgi:hypothetical protein
MTVAPRVTPRQVEARIEVHSSARPKSTHAVTISSPLRGSQGRRYNRENALSLPTLVLVSGPPRPALGDIAGFVSGRY